MGERMENDPPLYYRAHLFVCCNRRPEDHPRGSCANRGAERLRDHMKAKAKAMGLGHIRVNAAGCLDRCEHGPCLVIYPEGIWYQLRSTEDVDRVLAIHVRDGNRLPDLMLPREIR